MHFGFDALGFAGDLFVPELPGIGTFLAEKAKDGIDSLADYYAAGYTDNDFYDVYSDGVSHLDSSYVSSGYTGFTTEYYVPFEYVSSPSAVFSEYSFDGTATYISGRNSDASFILNSGPIIDNSSTPSASANVSFSVHCYVAGDVYLLCKSINFSPSIDCNVYLFVSSSFYLSSFLLRGYPSLRDKLFLVYCVTDPSSSYRVSNRDDIKLKRGYVYCIYLFARVPLFFDSGNSVSQYSISGPCINNYPIQSVQYDGDSSQVPSSTRLSSYTQNVYNYNQTDSSTKYYIGKVDNSNNVTNVYNVNIFDETTNEFRDPYTDKPYQVTDWTYDYAQRIYYLTLADDSLLYNGTPVKHLAIWYANDAMYYIGLDDTFEVGEPYLDHVIFLDPFQYVIAEKKDDSGTGSDGHKHVFTSETTTPPSCTGTGVRTYTCQFCDYSYDEIIPAAGHQWEVTEVKDTEFNDNGDVTAAGYTLYTCAVCGETYKQWSNTGQPGPPTGNTGTGSGGGGSGGSSGSGTSFWDKLKDSVLGLLADLIDAVFGLITDVLSAVLGLVKDLLSFLFGFLSSTVIKGITDLFSAFGSLKLELPGPVTTVFAFFSGVILALPVEVKSLMIFGVAALFLIAIFKMVKA